MRSITLIVPFLFVGLPSFSQSQFADVTQLAGIDHYFHVFQGIFGGGAAALDYNDDGWEDVFITGGAGKDALYKNNGDGTFTNVIDEAGFDGLNNSITQGVVCADVNRDGKVDVFITTIAKIDGDKFTASSNFLFINNGDGSFTDRTRSYGLDHLSFSTGAAFGDINADGFPDLYVSNFFNRFDGRLDKYLGAIPEGDRAPAHDLLYINSGSRFVEVSEHYGLTHTGFGFGGVFTDYDNDGDMDLIIINDFGYMATPNLLYRNEFPKTEFTDVSKLSGFNLGINAMGVGVGDYDLDGYLDYFISNISSSPFLINPGKKNAPFVDKTRQLGTSYPLIYTAKGEMVSTISWGANFFDYDNDLDLDLFVANGSINPSIVPNPNIILENRNGQFVMQGPSFGLSEQSIGRGSITFDFDNDGYLDLLVVNQSPYQEWETESDFKGVRLYRNQGGERSWLKVRLSGDAAEKNGLGSRIEVFVSGKKLIREIDGGSSHMSQNSTIAHFGLGRSDKVDSVSVRWIGGKEQKLFDVDANQLIEIKQAVITGFAKGESAKSDILLYPNPVSHTLFVEVGERNLRDATIEVYSNTGQVVDSFQLNNTSETPHNFQWRIPPLLPAGIYVIKVITRKEILTKVFVKN
jgi:enediyne biosynthesis protein E4